MAQFYPQPSRSHTLNRLSPMVFGTGSRYHDAWSGCR